MLITAARYPAAMTVGQHGLSHPERQRYMPKRPSRSAVHGGADHS